MARFGAHAPTVLLPSMPTSCLEALVREGGQQGAPQGASGDRRKRRNRKNKELVRKLKSQPCADCGREFPWYVMDFDHTGEKTGEVSSFVFTYSTDRLLAEVKLCDVVCANCHRERTYRRLSQARFGLRPQGEALGLVQPGM